MIVTVLDTNTLVSGVVGARRGTSAPALIMRRWRTGDIDLVVSDHIIEEVEVAFRKPYFRARLSASRVARTLLLLRTEATLVQITTPVDGIATHPEDDLVLATALSGAASFLVTGSRVCRASTAITVRRSFRPASSSISLIASNS